MNDQDNKTESNDMTQIDNEEQNDSNNTGASTSNSTSNETVTTVVDSDQSK